MKQVLIIFGAFVLFLISIATMFKIMHWPGAGPLFVIGMTLFSGFYLPLFFIERIIQNKTALVKGLHNKLSLMQALGE